MATKKEQQKHVFYFCHSHRLTGNRNLKLFHTFLVIFSPFRVVFSFSGYIIAHFHLCCNAIFRFFAHDLFFL